MRRFTSMESALSYYWGEGYQAVLMAKGRWIMYGMNTKFSAIELIKKDGTIEAHPVDRTGIFLTCAFYPQNNLYRLPRAQPSQLL